MSSIELIYCAMLWGAYYSIPFKSIFFQYPLLLRFGEEKIPFTLARGISHWPFEILKISLQQSESSRSDAVIFFVIAVEIIKTGRRNHKNIE